MKSDSPRMVFVVCFIVTVLLALTALVGCAMLPDDSGKEEGAFIALGAMDTVQLMRCEPRPGRTLAIGLAVLTVHTFVASWLDDDNSTWRPVFRGVSIGAVGGDTIYNQARGCKL